MLFTPGSWPIPMKQDTMAGQPLDKFTATMRSMIHGRFASPQSTHVHTYITIQLAGAMLQAHEYTYLLTYPSLYHVYTREDLSELSYFMVLTSLQFDSRSYLARYATLIRLGEECTTRSARLGHDRLFLCPFLNSGTEHLSGADQL